MVREDLDSPDLRFADENCQVGDPRFKKSRPVLAFVEIVQISLKLLDLLRIGDEDGASFVDVRHHHHPNVWLRHRVTKLMLSHLSDRTSWH